MKKLKLTKREYIVAGVLALAGVYAFLGVVVTTAIIGIIGGAIISANMPEKYRRRLVMGRKAKASTITVPAAPPVPGERRDDVYGGGS